MAFGYTHSSWVRRRELRLPWESRAEVTQIFDFAQSLLNDGRCDESQRFFRLFFTFCDCDSNELPLEEMILGLEIAPGNEGAFFGIIAAYIQELGSEFPVPPKRALKELMAMFDMRLGDERSLRDVITDLLSKSGR